MCRTCPWSLLWITIGALLSVVSLLPAQTPDTATLDQANADLSSPHFAVREAATRLLWQHADVAHTQLEEARKSNDPEVRVRAERIWEAFQLGILPDTPLDVVRQIYAFHDGNLEQKQTIIQQLVAADNLSAAFRLLRTVEDSNARNELALIISKQVRAKLMPHLLSESWDEAAPLLKRAALGDVGMRDYAAFAYLTGQLDPLLAEPTNTAQERRLKSWLLRAAGNMDDALKLADGDEVLSRTIRAANGDALAFSQDELAQARLTPLQELRAGAFQARLTQDQDGLDQAIKSLLTLSGNGDNSYSQRFAIDALLLNDVIEPTLPFLPKLIQQTRYDIQTYRGTYGAALKSLGIEVERPPYTAWVEKRCKAIRENEEGTAFQEIVDFAKRIFEMGEEEEANRILGLVFEATEKDPERRKALISQEIQLGAREIAEKHLRILGESGTQSDELRRILPFRQDLVEQWYQFILQTEKKLDGTSAVIKAWHLVDVSEDETKPRPEAIAILDEAQKAADVLGPNERIQYLHQLYITASVNHAHDHVTRFAETLALLTQDTPWFLALGNAHAEKKRWKEAAEAYEKVWQKHRLNVKGAMGVSNPQEDGGTLQPSYLYLAGMAHEKAGNKDKGTEMIQQARLLCLGDLSARYTLANAMKQNGDDRAADEWALITRLSQIDESTGSWAFYHLIDTVKKSDPAKAVTYLERVAVARHTLDVNMAAQFTFDIRMRSLTHQYQALAHIKAGDAEAAVASLESYWKLTPGNASIGEELLPMLEKAGKTAEAKDYYEKTRLLAVEACRLFPNSAMAHNNLAWLDARSRRHLDQALEHAEIAVRLKPNTAAYLDTLAEVHFTMGNREKALELSATAVKLTPDDEELLGQRARFENDPLPAKRPEGE